MYIHPSKVFGLIALGRRKEPFMNFLITNIIATLFWKGAMFLLAYLANFGFVWILDFVGSVSLAALFLVIFVGILIHQNELLPL